jgi:hypothetical protein
MSDYRLTLTQFDSELREEVQIKLEIDDNNKDFFFDEKGLFKEFMENNISIKIESL